MSNHVAGLLSRKPRKGQIPVQIERRLFHSSANHGLVWHGLSVPKLNQLKLALELPKNEGRSNNQAKVGLRIKQSGCLWVVGQWLKEPLLGQSSLLLFEVPNT